MKQQNNINQDSGISLVSVLFYLIPLFLNWNIGDFFEDRIMIKGAILEGISQYILLTLFLIFNFYLLNNVFKAFLFINEEKLTKSKLFKEFLLSPFFLLWLITLVYQNFSMEYYKLYINIILYIWLYYFQYRFIKKMINYSKQFENQTGLNKE